MSSVWPIKQNIFIRKFDSKVYSVRDGDLKLIVKKKSNVKELYNLKNDLSEQDNIAEKNQKDVKRLSAILDTWETELVDPLFLGLIHTKSWQNKMAKKKNN